MNWYDVFVVTSLTLSGLAVFAVAQLWNSIERKVRGLRYAVDELTMTGDHRFKFSDHKVQFLEQRVRSLEYGEMGIDSRLRRVEEARQPVPAATRLRRARRRRPPRT